MFIRARNVELNPMVTIVDASLRGRPILRTIQFVFIQVAMMFLGFGAVFLMFRTKLVKHERDGILSVPGKDNPTGTAGALASFPMETFHWSAMIFFETLLAASTTFLRYAVADLKRQPALKPWERNTLYAIVSATLSIIFNIGGAGSNNPARELGSRLVLMAARYRGNIWNARHW